MWRAGKQRSPRLAQVMSDVRDAECKCKQSTGDGYDVAVKNMELAAGKALAFFVLEHFGIVGLPPSDLTR